MTETQVYNGEHTLSFDHDKHKYYLDGIGIPSVTTILDIQAKPALRIWAVNETIDALKRVFKPGRSYNSAQHAAIIEYARKAQWRKSDEARTIGSTAHDWIENYSKFYLKHKRYPEVVETPERINEEGVMLLPHNPEAYASILAFLDWVKAHDVQFVDVEKKIVSRKDWWAGTRDTRAIINDRLGVWDYKTSKAIYGEYFIQVGTYGMGGIEMGEDRPDDLWILRIPKDGGEFEAKNTYELKVDYTMEDLYEVFLGLKKAYDFNGGRKRRVKTI